VWEKKCEQAGDESRGEASGKTRTHYLRVRVANFNGGHSRGDKEGHQALLPRMILELTQVSLKAEELKDAKHLPERANFFWFGLLGGGKTTVYVTESSEGRKRPAHTQQICWKWEREEKTAKGACTICSGWVRVTTGGGGNRVRGPQDLKKIERTAAT